MSDPRKRIHLSPDQYIWRDPADCDDFVEDDDGPAVNESEHDAETEAEDAR